MQNISKEKSLETLLDRKGDNENFDKSQTENKTFSLKWRVKVPLVGISDYPNVNFFDDKKENKQLTPTSSNVLTQSYLFFFSESIKIDLNYPKDYQNWCKFLPYF